MEGTISDQIESSVSLTQKIAGSQVIQSQIRESCRLLISSLGRGNKILFAGNGGSAAHAQHLAAELVNKFYFDREGLPGIALTTDSSILTSIANDYGYEKIFTRQLQALGKEGDVFVCLSTSGNSDNIIEALEECRQKKITSIGFTGASGGRMRDLCDICICIPSDDTPRIQEMHILIGHIICSIAEREIFHGPEKAD